ncbi:MAG: ABC transporter ATP-binding protein [Kiritimatiellales bacterium]|nr:ABC transporter ATP-binding protein [Kiritimatiellales bacterium]
MLELDHLNKSYTKGSAEIRALADLSCELKAGTFYAVYGASGAGKSTMLMIIGGMLRPDSGAVVHGGKNIYGLSSKARNDFRKRTIGFVFQKFHLMPYLTVAQNIRMPLSLRKGSAAAQEKTAAAAARVGLSDRLSHYPHELSVGQQQRVAIARALVGDPQIILADEPTGNLDEANQRMVAACLHEEADRGKLVVAVTHESALYNSAHHRLQIADGRLMGQGGT